VLEHVTAGQREDPHRSQIALIAIQKPASTFWEPTYIGPVRSATCPSRVQIEKKNRRL